MIASLALAATLALTPTAPDIMVIGDSISYRDSAENPAWWHHIDGTIHLYAESGSGMSMKGYADCSGTKFEERLDVIDTLMPDKIIVAGGRNDWGHCEGTDRVYSTHAEMRAGIKSFTHDLAVKMKRLGIPKSDVIMAVPWGSINRRDRSYIWKMVRLYAVWHGFTWVPVPHFGDYLTVDGTHPNKRGNERLADFIRSGL